MKFLTLIVFLGSQLFSFANTIVVGKDKPISSITKGIELAKNGDTVKV